MRIYPRTWSAETWVCSMRGHVAPALDVARLRPEDADYGVDVDGRTRLARCLRCDLWVRGAPPTPAAASSEVLPEPERLPRPERGRALDDRILLRAIAIERAVHCVFFGLLSVGLLVLDADLPGLQDDARRMVDGLTQVVDGTSRAGSHEFFARELNRLADLRPDTIRGLLVVSLAYCALEGTEAVGLWLGRRWAEYLTVVATAGFLPLEIDALASRVTTVRVTLLALNVVILVYLVWSKRLFGLRGGAAALRASRAESATLPARG